MEIPQATQSHERIENRINILKGSLVNMARASTLAIFAIRLSGNNVEERIATYNLASIHAEDQISKLEALSNTVAEKQSKLKKIGEEIDRPELDKLRGYLRKLIGTLIVEIETELGTIKGRTLSFSREKLAVERKIEIFANMHVIPGENIRFGKKHAIIIRALRKAGEKGLTKIEIDRVIQGYGFSTKGHSNGKTEINKILADNKSSTKIKVIRVKLGNGRIERRYVLEINPKNNEKEN
jgi:hypothetical protein